MLRYTCVRKYSQAAAAAIQVCLPFTDLKKAKMVHLLEHFFPTLSSIRLVICDKSLWCTNLFSPQF
jgi:hypothetical protein